MTRSLFIQCMLTNSLKLKAADDITTKCIILYYCTTKMIPKVALLITQMVIVTEANYPKKK